MGGISPLTESRRVRMFQIRIESFDKKDGVNIKIPIWLAGAGLKFAKVVSKESDFDLASVQDLLQKAKEKKGIFLEIEDHSKDKKITLSII